MKWAKTGLFINRIVHKTCGKSFYEDPNHARDKCPHCKVNMVEESEVSDEKSYMVTHTKQVYVEVKTGELKYVDQNGK